MMSILNNKNPLAILVLALTVTLALACGSGGGGVTQSASENQSSFKFKPGDFLPLITGSSVYIAELGGSDLVLKETSLNAGLDQEIEVSFIPDVSYSLVMKVNGLPYLKTTIMAADIASAASTGVLNIGAINAITTYLTGILETRINGSRRASKNSDAIIAQFLNEFFGSTVISFNKLSYTDLLTGTITGTTIFHKHKNRINLMRLYFGAVRTLEGNGTDLQKVALTSLFNGMIDETNEVALVGLMGSPALPSFLNSTVSTARTAFLLSISAQGEFLIGTGVLLPTQLGAIFVDAINNPELVLMAIKTPSAIASGVISGSGNVDVILTLTSGKLLLTTSSKTDGSYAFTGIVGGNYLITPTKTGYVFDPASISFESVDNISVDLAQISSVINRGQTNGIVSSSNQLLSAGYYPSITIIGSDNLVSQNIRTGVGIFGVIGSLSLADFSAGLATTVQTLKNTIGYGATGKIIGTVENYGDVIITPGTNTQTSLAGYYNSYTISGNASLTGNNISYGINIFGATGANVYVVNTGSGSALASDILSGKTAYVKGVALTGTITTQSLSDSSTTVAAGYYGQTDLVTVEPDLSTNNIKSGVTLFGIVGSTNVLDTVAGTALAAEITTGNTAYVAGNLITGTLAPQSLSNNSSTVAAGVYAASDLATVDTDLTANNISSSANIFGIQGVHNDTSANATASQLLAGYKAWVNGIEITGTLPNQTLNANTTVISAGNYSAGNLVVIESDLISNNIKSGIALFGVSGNSSVVDTLTGDAVSTDLLSGKTAYVNGALVTGTIAGQTLSANSSVVSAGIYSSANLALIDTDLAANNIKSGVIILGITGSATVVDTITGTATAAEIISGKTAYVAGTLLTGTLATQALSANMPNVSTGYYAAGNLLSIESDLVSGNISSGVNIFGVIGSSIAVNTTTGNASAGQMITGYKAWVAGSEVIGTLSNKSLSNTTVMMSAGNYSAGNLALIDLDLASANIKSGVTVFGIAGNASVVDTQSANAVAADLLSGTTAWVNGTQITGNVASLTLSANTSVLSAGSYGTDNLATIDTDLSSGNILSGVSIFGVAGLASVVNTASGNAIAAHIKSGRTAYVGGALVTGTLATKTLSATNNIVLAGYYSAGNMQTIETDLVAGNISTGVNIFGVVGTKVITDTTSGNAIANQILAGYTGWVNGTEITGTLANQVLVNSSVSMSAGNYSAGNLVSLDADLVSGNIRSGTNIFGVLGSINIDDTQSGNVSAGDLANGRTVWVAGNAITGSNTYVGPSANAYSGNMTIGGNVFKFQSQYCIVDVSGGATASIYPVKFTNTKPDLTGAGNLEYKTNKIVLKWIPAGVFTMGNTGVADNVHQVTLTKGFFAGVFQTTQKQWLNVMSSFPLGDGSQNYNNSGNTLPVSEVSWDDIRGISGTYDWPTVTTIGPNTFMGNLLAKTGLNFDLPTEGEWEYACRAGTTSIWSYGNAEDGDYMWYSVNNTPAGTKEVGGKLPNSWGLYDVHGNVWEWGLDWRSATYSPAGDQTDPVGTTSGSTRVMRGGGFDDSDFNTVTSLRNGITPSTRNYSVGLRIFLRPK
jgi:formylglycine-generating enzyme required for sulfatase activity